MTKSIDDNFKNSHHLVDRKRNYYNFKVIEMKEDEEGHTVVEELFNFVFGLRDYPQTI
jgi:hypothetical protein